MGVLSRSHTHSSKNVFKPFYIDRKIKHKLHIFFFCLHTFCVYCRKGLKKSKQLILQNLLCKISILKLPL